MTSAYIEYSPSNMEALHRYVFQLTGKRAKVQTLAFPTYDLIRIEVRDDGVYLIHGRDLKEKVVPVSLPEAVTYIREQVFIQTLEN